MRKLFYFIATILCASAISANAQKYLQVVTYEGSFGSNGTFISSGMGKNKKEAQTNAIESLFYTLFYQGVDGVNDGKPLVVKDNPMYTNTFFNKSAKYVSYVTSNEDAGKFTKVGGQMQGPVRITIRLNQLISDVRKNTGYEEELAKQQEKKTAPKPTIIVVPYKKTNESYAAIIENDSDARIAIAAVQKGFEDAGIKTIDLQARIDAMIRRGQYEDNAGAASSNDKELLMSSGADVYVTVDLMKDFTSTTARVALVMKAYETASGTIWASEDGWTNRFQTTQTEVLCAYAVKDNLPDFLEQITKNYSLPSRAVLQISISDASLYTLQDAACSDGELLMDFIMNWLDDNAFEGDYHVQGIVDESAVFDYVMIPREDEKGNKMNASKFSRQLNSALKDAGISCTTRLEGNTILLMLNL